MPASLGMATELKLAAGGSAGWDNNVARSQGGEKIDGTLRLTPSATIQNESKDFSYSATYQPHYERYIRSSKFSALSHFFNGAMGATLGGRTRVNLREYFSLSQSIAQFDDDGISGSAGEVRRDDVLSNTAQLSILHPFTARTNGILAFSHRYRNSERKDTATSNSFTARGSMLYAVSAKHQAGGGASLTWQAFDSSPGRTKSDTYFYRFFASWIYTVSDRTKLSVNAGPMLVNTKRDSGITNTIPNFIVPVGATTLDDVYSLVPGVSDPGGTYYVDGVDSGTDATSILVTPGDVLTPYHDVPTIENCDKNPSIVFYVETQCDFNQVVSDATAIGTVIGAGNTDLISGDPSDWRLTLAGSVALSHRWNTQNETSLSYSRSDAGATTLGESTIADTVVLNHQWRATDRLSFTVRGDWLQRKSANDNQELTDLLFPVGDIGSGIPAFSYGTVPPSTNSENVDTTFWRGAVTAAYQLTRRSQMTLYSGYQKQDTKGNGFTGGNPDFGSVTVLLGFRYNFDPIRF